MRGIFVMLFSYLSRSRPILKGALLACFIFSLASAASALQIAIINPPAGTIVDPGDLLDFSTQFSGAVAGVDRVVVSLEGDSTLTWNYNPSPPTNSGTITDFYFVPSGASPGQVLTITATVYGYADSPVSTSRTVTVRNTPPPPPDKRQQLDALQIIPDPVARSVEAPRAFFC